MDEAKVPSRAVTRRRGLVAVALVTGGLLVGVGVRPRQPSTEIAAAAAPFTVDHDVVRVPEGSGTWSYLTLATAALTEPIAPEPVPGRVAFDEARSTPVTAPLPGHVDTVAVRFGQRVEKGDRLVAVHSTALVDVNKELEQSRAEESAREKVVERLRSLVALKAEPEKELVAAEQDLRQARLAREAAELKIRSLDVVETDGNLYWLEASRAGVVVTLNVLAGQEVGPDRSDPLLIIADLGEVIVTADVPEDQVSLLQVGEAAAVVSPAAPDRTIPGRVEYVGEVVDPTRRMVDVRVRVANGERTLRPNAFVEVGFSIAAPPRVVVPAEAVVNDDQQSFVFVRGNDDRGTLERRAVTPGVQRAGKAEIVTGLAPGETYVSKGAILLLNAIDLANG